MAFNPYESDRYQSLGRGHQYMMSESARSAMISGMISVVNEAAEARRLVEENERKRQEWYVSMDGRVHKNKRSALEGGLASDMANGERDCSGDNWQMDW